MTIPKQARKYFSELGRRGAKAKIERMTPEQLQAHSRLMYEARMRKKEKSNDLNLQGQGEVSADLMTA